jgi:hypothetical protein
MDSAIGAIWGLSALAIGLVGAWGVRRLRNKG